MKNNTITAPKGFLAAGLHCGIKKSKRSDLALLVCPAGATAAAVFTTNKIFGSPVAVSRQHIKSVSIDAVVANSGNANTCTGQKGIDDAVKMCRMVAREIESKPENVLVASTGIIGQPLPMNKIINGIAKAVDKLANNKKAGLNFAKAILTTDTIVKQTIRQIKISGKKITIAGTVKGAGMIAPNMATTLLFITTDLAIKKTLLSAAFKDAIGDSLNKLTVDGHQSTSDTAIILASGLAVNRPIETKCPRYKKFAAAVTDLCDDLAKQMVLDAEGATRIFKVVVESAASKADARKAARAVADYDLVKCAVHGCDPNWGRIICAVGSCGVKLKPEKLSCRLDNITVFKDGSPCKFDPKKASEVISQQQHTITVDLGVGKGTDFCYGCDLSKEYVTINADYHT